MHRESKNAVLMLLYNSRAVLFGFQTVNNNQLIYNKWIISTEPIAFETKHSNNATKAQPKIHPLRISIDTFIAKHRERGYSIVVLNYSELFLIWNLFIDFMLDNIETHLHSTVFFLKFAEIIKSRYVVLTDFSFFLCKCSVQFPHFI